MPPKLALLLCTVFVLFLLLLDRKQSPNVSPALWIPTVWMLSVAGRSLSGWFPSAAVSRESGSPLDRVFLIGLLCLGLFILGRRKFNWSIAIKENFWLILLIAYMLASILWSDIPYISFKRWSKELIAVVMAFLVLSEEDPRDALQSILRRTIYILIPFSLLLVKYFPEYGRGYDRWTGELMWIGVTVQKNGLGRLCMIAAIFYIWTFVRRWQGRDVPVVKFQTFSEMTILILTLYLLKGPPGVYPATATVALAAGFTALIGLLWMKKRGIHLGANALVVIISIIITIGIITPMNNAHFVKAFAPTLGRSETLTGRTAIWERLIPLFESHLIFGWGFGSFWTPENMEAIYGVGEAHNGYLDVCLGLGVAGLLLTTICLLSWCRKAQRALAHDYDWASLFICYLLMAAIHNIGESSFDLLGRHLMAVLLFLSVAVPKSSGLSQREGSR
jgi:exopolysaccharide production protein ExoQ